MQDASVSRPTLGWREWLALPQLGIPAIKAKIDTGARTSALHVFELNPFVEDGMVKVRFGIHPLQRGKDIAIYCTVPVLDRRTVCDSGGHREERYVIQTPVRMGKHAWPIEITLTNREDMAFRMLLGRTAMRKRFMVDPARSFVLGQRLKRVYDNV